MRATLQQAAGVSSVWSHPPPLNSHDSCSKVRNLAIVDPNFRTIIYMPLNHFQYYLPEFIEINHIRS